jgi:hypothetical protein
LPAGCGASCNIQKPFRGSSNAAGDAAIDHCAKLA